MAHVNHDHAVSLARVSAFVAESIGLHFPRERWRELERGLASAAEETNFADVSAYAHWLLSSPVSRTQLQTLASHLTIGETYFFREEKTFAALAEHILPALIRSRRGGEQRLRIWSAACSSGEEAFSLAILVRQLLPDLADWRVTILATDINPRALQKASAGIYGEWSFRGPGAASAKRFFSRHQGGYLVLPEIRQMVTFAPLNFMEDIYPSLATDTNAMDVILCRNVLMYFTPSQRRRVVVNLHRCLVDEGWLIVSPSETSQANFPEFTARNFPGAILYQKVNASRGALPAWMPTVDERTASPAAPASTYAAPLAATLGDAPPQKTAEESRDTSPTERAAALYDQGRFQEASETLLASFANHPPDARSFSLLARALANQGKLTEALQWCDRWILDNKLEAVAHYLRGVVLLEDGNADAARSALQRTVYLQPDFALAHFVLGSAARRSGAHSEAARHFRNALAQLARYAPDEVLPESDGLTARRLAETISTLSAMELAS